MFISVIKGSNQINNDQMKTTHSNIFGFLSDNLKKFFQFKIKVNINNNYLSKHLSKKYEENEEYVLEKNIKLIGYHGFKMGNSGSNDSGGSSKSVGNTGGAKEIGGNAGGAKSGGGNSNSGVQNTNAPEYKNPFIGSLSGKPAKDCSGTCGPDSDDCWDGADNYAEPCSP